MITDLFSLPRGTRQGIRDSLCPIEYRSKDKKNGNLSSECGGVGRERARARLSQKILHIFFSDELRHQKLTFVLSSDHLLAQCLEKAHSVAVEALDNSPSSLPSLDNSSNHNNSNQPSEV